MPDRPGRDDEPPPHGRTPGPGRGAAAHRSRLSRRQPTRALDQDPLPHRGAGSEFVHIRVEDLHLNSDPPQIHLTHAKGQANRYVPILPALAHELRTHLQGRGQGYLFESNRHTRYTARTVQTIVKQCAEAAGITKRVYPHLLRHSVATILLDSGQVPIDQVRKFLGHLHLSTTQIYAETSLQALGENCAGPERPGLIREASSRPPPVLITRGILPETAVDPARSKRSRSSHSRKDSISSDRSRMASRSPASTDSTSRPKCSTTSNGTASPRCRKAQGPPRSSGGAWRCPPTQIGYSPVRLLREPVFDPGPVLPRVAEVILVEEAFVAAELEVGEADLAGILGEPGPARPADAIIPAVDGRRWKWGSLQPKAIWMMSWSWARGLSLRTRIRRQIMGLTWRIQMWSL